MRPPETTNSRNTIHFLEALFREIKLIRDARQWLTICINLILIKSCRRLRRSWLMVQPSSKVLSGKISLAFSHWTPTIITQNNSRKISNKISAHFSNSWPSTSPKVLDTIPMAFLVFPHTRTWKKRSSITCGHSRTMASLTEQWSVSVLHLEKWERPHMPFSADTTPPRLLEELKVSKLSRTLRTGSELGLLRDKACTMVERECRSQVRILLIQPLLTLAALSSPSHQMSLKKLDKNGNRPSQTLTAPQTRLSVTSRIHAKMLHQELSQLDSKWVTTFLKSTLNNICINLATKSAISLSTNADFQVKIRTCSLLEMHSLSTSTPSTISIAIPSVLESTVTPRIKYQCTSQALGQEQRLPPPPKQLLVKKIAMTNSFKLIKNTAEASYEKNRIYSNLTI